MLSLQKLIYNEHEDVRQSYRRIECDTSLEKTRVSQAADDTHIRAITPKTGPHNNLNNQYFAFYKHIRILKSDYIRVR